LPYRWLELGALARLERSEAQRVILEAYRRWNGHRVSTARELGMSTRHLSRLVVSLGIQPQVFRMREKKLDR
jgi:hypothetical protein